jgi:hypothetical protein
MTGKLTVKVVNITIHRMNARALLGVLLKHLIFHSKLSACDVCEIRGSITTAQCLKQTCNSSLQQCEQMLYRAPAQLA